MGWMASLAVLTTAGSSCRLIMSSSVLEDRDSQRMNGVSLTAENWSMPFFRAWSGNETGAPLAQQCKRLNTLVFFPDNGYSSLI
jgi:hypothetical protein